MADPVTSKAAKTPPLVVLSPTRHAALVAALDAAVAADPSLAGARTLLLAPLDMLQALARDAVGALGDDVLAAERLRLLLALAATQMPPLTAFREVLGDPDASSAASHLGSALLDVPAVPCDDAVVHNGALVIVALAAGRVGKSTSLADPLLNNVLVTALAAGPAEALARALASGMEPAQLRALLAGLTSGGNAQDRRLSAVIATFLADACERARWACLEQLFTQVRGDVAGVTWDAAGTGGIVDVDPRTACPGQPVAIRVEPVPDGGPIIFLRAQPTAPEPPRDSAHVLPLLADRTASVVFAGQGRRSVARLPDAVDLQTGVVTVTVPAGAHVGWLGFADPALLAASNSAREELRQEWADRNTSDPVLRGAPVPVESIPLLRAPPTPPRSPQARFDGGAPVIVSASISPAVADPGGELRLAWRVQGGAVHIDPRPGKVPNEGEIRVKAPEDHASAEFVLVCEGCGDPLRRTLRSRVRVRIRSVAADQPERAAGVALKLVGSAAAASSVNVRFSALAAAPQPLVAGEPVVVTATLNAADARGRPELVIDGETKGMKLDGATATITLPGRYAVDGLTGTVVFRAPDGEIDDRRDFGPIAFVTLRTRRLMVIRPGLLTRDLHRVDGDEVARAVEEARRALAMEIEADEPVWVDDEELSLAAAADGPDVSATTDLLERLHALAARTPGREDALWVAVVPRPENDFLRVEPAEAARAVAVCTPGALARLLDAELPEAEARVLRLRIAGTVDGGGSVRLQPLRVEDRAAGPGARVASGLRAVALDAQGRVRASRPVRLLTADRPARLFVLLPITNDATDLEIRVDDGQPPLPGMDYGFGSILGGLCDDGSRSDPRLVRRIHRSDGKPTVSDVELGDADALAFEYDHTRSARASIVVEAGGSGVWGTILRLGACQQAGTLPAGRLRLGEDDRVRVAATDGWNTDFAPDAGLPISQTAPFRVAARHAGGLRFWADADGTGDPIATWSFGGETATGSFVTLPEGFTGELTMSVERNEQVATDTRTISAGGRVDCRRTELSEVDHG
jgi:hypothetical protein